MRLLTTQLVPTVVQERGVDTRSRQRGVLTRNRPQFVESLSVGRVLPLKMTNLAVTLGIRWG